MKILELHSDKEKTAFFGFFELDGHYFQFQSYPDEILKMEMPGPFDNYAHFVGVMSKFNPYTFFLKKPFSVKDIGYQTLREIERLMILQE